MGGVFGKKKKPAGGGVKIKAAAEASGRDYPAFKVLMIGDPSVRHASCPPAASPALPCPRAAGVAWAMAARRARADGAGGQELAAAALRGQRI